MAQYRIRKTENISGITENTEVDYQEVIVAKSGGTFTGPITTTTIGGDGNNLTNLDVGIHNVIYVGKELSNTVTFTSIKSAIDSITGNSTTNRFIVSVGPGVFVEDTITLKSYITLEGSNESTVIEVDSTAKDVIVLVGNSNIENLFLRGSTDTGKAAITVSSSMGPSVSAGVTDINFGDTNLLFRSSLIGGQFAIISMVNCITNANTSFINGFDVSGDGNTVISLSDSKSSVNSAVTDYIKIQGTGNRLIMSNYGLLVQSPLGGSLSNFVRVFDGATIDIISTGIDGANVGVFNENTGVGVNIRLTSLSIINSITSDINIEHPATTGYFNGTATQSKIEVENTNTTFKSTYIQPSGGLVNTGEFNWGRSDLSVTNVTDFLLNGGPLGLFSGGEITLGTGSTINVSSGTGYVKENATENLHYITFSGTTNLSIPSGETKYVSVNELGMVKLSPSFPVFKEEILLGRVISDSTEIVSINNTPIKAASYQVDLENYRRNILGTTFKSGCIVVENTLERKVDVTSGNFYYGNNNILPTGGNAILFTPIYKSATAGQWVYSSTADTVSNSLYDTGTGSTGTIPAEKWVKHAFYVNGDGVDEKYFLQYGDTLYDTQLLAEDSLLPSAPSFFTEGIVPIASFVLSASSTNITVVKDERSFLGVGASEVGGGGGGTGNHSELINLSSDDHLQYLLVNGSRAMGGNLNVGGNQITNVGNVDGVDVSLHGGRHLPNGSDPVSTGATPVDIGISNNIGIANAFSRSDHQHNHGDLGGGSLHSNATTSVGGFMSSADKNKISILYTGGTIGGNLSATTFNSLGMSIGSSTINSKSILDIVSTTKGVLLPRMTTTQRNAITATIPKGLIIYNITTNRLNQYNGTSWKSVGSGSGGVLTTKGDILAYTTTDSRLPVGTNNQLLMSDNATSTGLKWGSDILTSTISATSISATTYYGDGSNLTGVSGGSSKVTGSTQTTNATPVEVDKINTLTDNATNIVEVYIKAYESAAAEWGVWKRTLTVTSVSGTVVIREENADVDKTSSGLNANSINFTVNGGDIDIDVTGIAATTIDWESAYQIII